MYTQCPDCSTAFRVTADVLKQAAGKVRCGGCGIAFNALEYLSEAMPEQQATKEDEMPLPELTPERHAPQQGTPMAISAEQSAALLKTLDELAGSDIRIEDTGAEWRVLDDDEADGDALEAGEIAAAQGVDEILDESPTPVDQFLTKTPNQIEAREIFEESASAPAQTPVDELRFDDNTPLPDDFDLDDASSYGPATSDGETSDSAGQIEAALQAGHPRDIDDSPVDIALGDPDDWADILGEFSEPPEPYVPPLEAELSALEEAAAEDGSDAGPAVAAESDVPLDAEPSASEEAAAEDGSDAGPAVAAGSDVLLDAEPSAPEEAAAEDGSDAGPAGAGESDVPLDAEPSAPEEVAAEDGSDAGPAGAAEDDTPLDMDTQFALQAEAMGIDLSGIHAESEGESEEQQPEVVVDEAPVATEPEPDDEPEEMSEPDDSDDGAELELSDESGEVDELELLDDSGAAPEIELADDSGAAPLPGDDRDEEAEASLVPEDEEATRRHRLDEDEQADEAPLEFGSIEKAMAELEEQSDVFDKGFFDDGSGDEFEEARIEEDDIVLEDERQQPDEPQHVVPELSEEEQTINLLIDQELLSMAVEDEDGFASTIVVAGEDAEDAVAGVREQQAHDDADAGFESIVMEGEFVRTALGQEKLKADIAAAAALAEQADLARAAEDSTAGAGRKRGMAAAAVVLSLILVVQVLHQSRQALATIPIFNDTVGSLYRAIGMPLAPAWDVTGWRFEARRDILEEEADTLTVISRIGNTSAKPLPYPLVTISLTDRFEEIVGTRTLYPADYLTRDLDASEMVQPGNNFTAVMTIESPSEDATGYKLQACYRQPDAQLRCHVPTFK